MAAAPDLEKDLADRIREAGWLVSEIYRHYPPRDTHELSEREVLFTGWEIGKPADSRPLTAYVPNGDGFVIVGEGW
jgi:hypothetical protein